MQTFRRELKNQFGLVTPGAAFVFALLFVFCAGSATGQYTNAGDDPQSFSGNQAATPSACYLGSSSRATGATAYGAKSPDAGFGQDGAGADFSQSNSDLQQGSNSWQGFDPDPAVYGQGSDSPWTDSMQQGSTGFAQPMLTAQIVAILQQAPDTLSTLRDLAARLYGVDPSTIPDAGIYNCVQQDPNFRNQATSELISEGYAINPQQAVTGRGASTQQQLPAAGRTQSYSPGPYTSPSPNPYTTATSGSRGFPRSPAGAADPPPREQRRMTAIPYPNVSSLRDLYAQEVPAGGRLRRFGSDAFLFGTGNANLLPTDLPVGPDYVLGAGDNLIVNMWGGQSARLTRTIDRQGQIELPEAGAVAIEGLTITQAQSTIQRALATQFQDEHVELSLGRVRTVRVYVVGDVQRPGAYDVSSLSTPLNALYEAGGPTSRGSLRKLMHYRGKQLVQEIDLYDFLLHGIRSGVGRLLPGDTILIPPLGAQVSIAGMVRRPALYELNEKEDLREVLELAGGVLASADLKEIRIERVVAHERHTMLRVQIPDGAKGPAELPSFQVQDGDTIQVSAILPFNDQVVYLEGHVFKPGPYAWREGMTVNDLLHAYQDVMPEPATHAEIVRLVPPDLHPETIPFNLPDVLIGDDPVTLQPFDTVRVYGRYQLDPPRVSIFGAVLKPGTYPMSQGMTVTGLVRMAGGFRRSAYQQEADLSSYTVQDGQKVLLHHSVVAVGKALDGDHGEDVALQPGDVVGIRQITGWNDIGASITITGEVKFAGTYGIVDGERLSSVLKRAGGFRAEAYPEGAVLERVQVRQLEEGNRQEMIRRVESTVPNAGQGINGTSQEQLSQMQAMEQQRQEVLTALRNHPSKGRLVIKISADAARWQNAPDDIELRAGDRLYIPKRPDFVLVSGQVYNPTGITYRRGKDVGWYLRQAGGVTRSGDRRALFVLRADGSVIGNGRSTVFSGGLLSVKLRPGDSVIVPEKVIGGSLLWRNMIGAAQILSSVAVTGAVAGAF